MLPAAGKPSDTVIRLQAPFQRHLLITFHVVIFQQSTAKIPKADSIESDLMER